MSEPNLARAGRIVERYVRPGESRLSPAAARIRLMDALERHRSQRRWIPLAAAAAATVVVVAVLLSRPVDRTTVSFTVGPDAVPGQIGAYVTPQANQPLQLRFSEGSLIELEPKTRARVTQTTSRGAVVLVETGHARVDVVHHRETDWRVLAGPYTIEVRGTSFDVGFDSPTQTLEVVMRSGVVFVEGPGIASPLEIRGAQRFVHTASPVSSAVAAAENPTPEPASVRDDFEPESAPDDSQPTPSPDPAAQPRAASSGTDRSEGSGSATSWAALVARGEYRQVLESAEQRGIDQALASAGPTDLMALGNAARFTGRGAVASRAYLAARRRFAGSPQAAQAAFLLGRMAEGGNPNAAITWYDRYVTEAPAGSFVAEALGRRMVALKRSGDPVAAQAAAESYLQRFPSGPYAGVAREITTP